jgi:hypothetical protein
MNRRNFFQSIAAAGVAAHALPTLAPARVKADPPGSKPTRIPSLMALKVFNERGDLAIEIDDLKLESTICDLMELPSEGPWRVKVATSIRMRTSFSKFRLYPAIANLRRARFSFSHREYNSLSTGEMLEARFTSGPGAFSAGSMYLIIGPKTTQHNGLTEHAAG